MAQAPTVELSFDGTTIASNSTTLECQAPKAGGKELPLAGEQPDRSHYRLNSVPGGVVTKSTDEDFDDYGAELGPEARVWKTYVKESSRFDSEKVAAWNKSLDIIIIFAALFSTISAAFVIESSKELKDDPAERSAKALEAILQILRDIANSSQPFVPPISPAPAKNEFTASWTAVLINTLWFLALCLSVATSLIAILAKEWCYKFMSGRTGHPYLQAKMRQERWDALQRWKLPEVLMLLPSLIHLALLLFAIGLCIHLWHIHIGMAIPVVLVSFVAFGLYAASTALPLLYQLCPYSSTASGFVMAFRNILVKNTGARDNTTLEQDMTTCKALAWLIQNCEDPRSMDIALQAIAGADERLPLSPLERCHAHSIVCRRMAVGSIYPQNYEVVFSLYARALAVLQPPIGRQEDEEGQYNHLNELKRKIRSLQIITESAVVNLLATKKFPATHSNLLALRIGNTAPSHCLQSLGCEPPGRALDALNSAVTLLERYGHDWDLLHPAALRSLVIGTATLLSCSSVRSNPATVVTYARRLLHVDLHRGVCGLLLTAFSISQNNYPGWTHPPPHSPAARAERAIELISYYSPNIDDLDITEGNLLDNFGVLGLLFNSSKCKLDDRDYARICHKVWLMNHDEDIIETFPQTFDLRRHAMERITEKLSDPHERESIWTSEASVEAHLQALHRTYNKSIGAPTSEVYLFVLESVCRIPSALVHIGGRLMQQFPWPEPSNILALVASQNIVALLVNGLDSDKNDVVVFATAQLCLFTDIMLRSPYVLAGLFQCEESCRPKERLEEVRQFLGTKLYELLNEQHHIFSPHVEIYSARVLNHIQEE